MAVAGVTRRFVGAPLRSDRLGDTLLPKRLALPVFCSDPLSSVAYATEQIILVLGLGGLALLHLPSWLPPPAGSPSCTSPRGSRSRLCCCSQSSSPHTARRVTPTRTAAAPTRSARTTSAR